MNQPVELTLEQQFLLRSFETQVENMDLGQCQQFLVELHRQMVVREALYKQMLGQQWGIALNPVSPSPEQL